MVVAVREEVNGTCGMPSQETNATIANIASSLSMDSTEVVASVVEADRRRNGG